MLDIQLLRNDVDAVADRLATRGYTLDTAGFLALESERKDLQTRTQDLQASRNSLSKQIGQLKAKGEDASGVMAEVAALKAVDEDFRSGDVSGQRDIVHITQTQQVVVIGFMGFGGQRISKEDQQVNLVAGNTAGNLLTAALCSA